ncbi:MAG: SURF1 family protein [Gemmatimonadaceae bacterium]|jgi:surfeit locus 1 family protein|nr:SURF1 family protein [Gemmatimonadaceae bacterium]
MGIIAAIGAAACIRLGIWQLDRLGQRRLLNAEIRARIDAPPVDVRTVLGDTTRTRFRRVTVSGVTRAADELAWAGRTRNGSPGVYLLSPVSLGDSMPLVLVNRGWVYSPDGSRVDLARWREGDTVRVTGYVEPFAGRLTGRWRASTALRSVRWMERDSLVALLGRPVAPFLVVVAGDTAPGDAARVARIPPPPLDEGPHQSYAMQWFAFATIAVVGYGAYLWNARRGG